MAGSKVGLFCYVCYLVDTTGAVVGEGRGSCSAVEKMGNENNAIKIAQKRAKIDAILSTGSLSDFFTQDVEDMKFDSEVQVIDSPKKPQVSPITNSQKIKITELLKEKARTTTDLKTYVSKKFKVEDLNKLTTTQASDVIKKISELPAPKPIEEDIEIDLDEVDQGMKK